jgi:hypothetical protein
MKLIGFVFGLCSLGVILTQAINLLSTEVWGSSDFLLMSVALSFISTACFAAHNVANK